MGIFGNLFNRGNKSKGPLGPKFDIGDKVKCIDDREHDIVFGKVYRVLNRVQTSCCGDWCYDVGLTIGSNEHTICNCSGPTDIQGRGIRWAGEFRFAPNDGVAEEEETNEEVNDGGDSLVKEAKEILEKEYSLN